VVIVWPSQYDCFAATIQKGYLSDPRSHRRGSPIFGMKRKRAAADAEDDDDDESGEGPEGRREVEDAELFERITRLGDRPGADEIAASRMADGGGGELLRGRVMLVAVGSMRMMKLLQIVVWW